jgi:hypothetical protein
LSKKQPTQAQPDAAETILRTLGNEDLLYNRLASYYSNTGAVAEVVEELARASEKFGSFNSAHEGFAILKEEVDELWTEVKKNNPNHISRMRSEAIQVGAMALRFVRDVCDR